MTASLIRSERRRYHRTLSIALRAAPRKRPRQGSTCVGQSALVLGQVAHRAVGCFGQIQCADPVRLICTFSVSRGHDCSRASRAYQSRKPGSESLVMIVTMWNHGNWADSKANVLVH